MQNLVRKLAGRMRRFLGVEQLRGEVADVHAKLDLLLRSHPLRGEVADVHAKLDLLLRSHPAAQLLNGHHGVAAATSAERVLHAPEGTASKVSQLVLAGQYRGLTKHGGPMLRFEDVEFRAFSQNGEDGILLYIFSLIGMGQRRCIEICASDGIQCNTANLIINHGWRGLLFDGNEQHIERGQAFYAGLGDTFCFPPKFAHAWITRENVNELIREQGFEGEIDLLSLDIDGNDYWIWEAIDVVRPRVVIAEIQCVWGSDDAVTVPYAKDFQTQFIDGFGVYCGASLSAFVKLARKKGYRLVGVQNLGFNAIFVADGIAEEILPEVDVESCLDRPFVHWAQRQLLPKVRQLPWVRV